ncbi:MAG: translocation/assembly module TamB domain-containing protein [Dysgonamonadaceae bacterium]|jgi:hypothetical protein|nr:translocation/assembly module TamB domain-containing protein [Dysgonamonadaceae bacterium]
MKARRCIVWALVILTAIFYVLPAALLQIPYFQQKAAQSAAGYLKEKIGTEVRIGQIDFRFFNQLILRDVYMEDRQGDTLLAAKRIAAGFDFFPLFKKQFRFSSVQLHTFALHLGKTSSEAPLNIQYIIDAFRTQESSKSTDIYFCIKDLSLKGGRVSYRVENTAATQGLLNPNNLDWRNIAAKIRLKHCTNDSLVASIQHLSAAEQSGFCVEQLALDLSVDTSMMNINHLDMKLPQSALHLTNVSADYRRFLSGECRADEIAFNVQIEPSQIRPDDVRTLFPGFTRFSQPLEIQGLAFGIFDDFRLKDFQVSSGDDMNLVFNATVRHLNASDLSRIYVDGRMINSSITSEGIQQMVNIFSPKPVLLPEAVRRLRSVSIAGEVLGVLNNLTASVRLQTGAGDLCADVNFGRNQTYFLRGKLAATDFNFKNLIDNDDWGNARFEVDLNATFTNGKDWKGTVDALVNELDYKAYRYENVGFSGNFTADSFDGSLKAESPDGRFTANGSFLLKGKDSQFNFSARATDLLLDRLHWIRKYQHPKLSFAVDARLTGDHPDNLAGSLAFHHLLFSNSNGIYSMDSLSIQSQEYENHKQLQVRSDILTGTVDGLFSIRTVVDALKQTIAAYLPSLIPAANGTADTEKTDFRWNFTMSNTQELSSILELPLTLYESSQMRGEYNSEQNRFRLNGNFPLFKFGASLIENGTVDLNNDNGAIGLKINGTKLQQSDRKLLLTADIKALNDSILSSVRWNDGNGSKYKGELDFITHLACRKGKYPLTAFVDIQPSQMVFNDSVWTLSPTAIAYKDGRLSIDRFEANHNRQDITIKGNISEDTNDQIYASLNEVDLDYIFKSLNIEALTFGGIATGYVTAKDLLATRQLSTRLNVRNFSFNDVVFGDMNLQGRWDDEQQGVEMKGTIVLNDTTYIGVDGFIYPIKEELSILFDAHRANAAFLRKYLDNVTKDFSGQITGRIRLFGDLNFPTVEGNAWVDNGSFGVDFLNTQYTFSDWVRMNPDEIIIQNVVLRDAYGNKAIATGSVRHDLLRDFHFSLNLSYENFLVFNATARTNPLFYGRMFGTGTASIKGTEDLVNIDVSLQNNDNTVITLNFMEQPDIIDYNFVNFVTKVQQPVSVAAKLPKSAELSKQASRTDIRANLLLTANPGATLEVVMDPATGDKISSTGDGTMQIQYGDKTPLRVFGNYKIEKGLYNFSFQQAFFRDFEIEEGSSINFRGDPFTAALDIKAAYTVSANLGDLDQQLVQQTEETRRLSARDNVPVNCVLLLSGPLEQPVIKFDLEFPGATSEVERQVKSYIRTEDMMNRQMVYLLLMGRFYTAPEYARSDTKYNSDWSLLASTLTSYISKIVSDNLKIGTNFNFHQTYEDGETNTEMELLLSSTLMNNRLIINGNFGYINNPYLNTLNNNVPLIGDFDIEYKLTKTGDIRLKGFNRYNYRNYYSLTPEMTQGFGILFRRDFNNINDLFDRRRQLPLLSLPPAEVPVALSDTTKVRD